MLTVTDAAAPTPDDPADYIRPEDDDVIAGFLWLCGCQPGWRAGNDSPQDELGFYLTGALGGCVLPTTRYEGNTYPGESRNCARLVMLAAVLRACLGEGEAHRPTFWRAAQQTRGFATYVEGMTGKPYDEVSAREYFARVLEALDRVGAWAQRMEAERAEREKNAPPPKPKKRKGAVAPVEDDRPAGEKPASGLFTEPPADAPEHEDDDLVEEDPE